MLPNQPNAKRELIVFFQTQVSYNPTMYSIMFFVCKYSGKVNTYQTTRGVAVALNNVDLKKVHTACNLWLNSGMGRAT